MGLETSSPHMQSKPTIQKMITDSTNSFSERKIKIKNKIGISLKTRHNTESTQKNAKQRLVYNIEEIRSRHKRLVEKWISSILNPL